MGLVDHDDVNSNAGFANVLDHLAMKGVDGVNHSGGWNSQNPLNDPAVDCQGSATVSSYVNDFVRTTDAFYVHAVGNEGYTGGGLCANRNVDEQCNVKEPGAVYAFQVGGTGNSYVGDWQVIKDAELYECTNRGGDDYLNGSRSIVDMVAPAWRQAAPTPGTCAGQEGCYGDPLVISTGGMSGTSYGAPQVSAMWAALYDQRLSVCSGFWCLYAASAGTTRPMMLLMGDRYLNSATGFDEVSGGGRLMGRHPTEDGMDAPWGYELGFLQVSPNTSYTFQVNGGAALPAGVDRLRFVIWWAEPNLLNDGNAQGEEGADIELKGVTTCSGAPTIVNDLSQDNKQMLTWHSIGGNDLGGICFTVTVNTYDIGPNPWDSNQQRRLLHWGYHWEDEARDDADGPLPPIR